MEWNVFYHDMNMRKIKPLNIFLHYSFNEDVQKHLKKVKDKDEFAKELRGDLFYYFRSKAEYEVVISPWCGGSEDEAIKVDIYDQVINNFDIFLDYVWNSKKRRKKNIICKTTNLPCCYCQPVCGSREGE